MGRLTAKPLLAHEIFDQQPPSSGAWDEQAEIWAYRFTDALAWRTRAARIGKVQRKWLDSRTIHYCSCSGSIYSALTGITAILFSLSIYPFYRSHSYCIGEKSVGDVYCFD